MTISNISAYAATVLACITSTLAQALPYNPSYLLQTDDSKVYIFSPSSSPQFALYDITNSVNTADAPEALTSQLPFLVNSSASYIPIATRNGLTVFSGECSEGDQELDLWTYGFGPNNKTWTQMHTTSSDSSVSANYLSAAFSFPMAGAQDVDSIYVFGGMCPDGAVNSSSWTADATYSNTMLTISPEENQDYEVSLTGQRAAPVAEAGLSITPLAPTTIGQDGSSQQQNFVLVGGHTQNAFINMSQVALFSMPEQAWAFIGINQPADVVVEPRSGHTAVLSEDGSRIFVFGGWVGAVDNPATPQLAILEVGAGYGGNSSWSWTVPDQNTIEQYSGGNGVYGHAATMLPGDVMMVTGGISISSQAGSQKKRDDITLPTRFYNTTSSTWGTTYTNPVTVAAKRPKKSGMNSTQKSGLGAGLGVGVAAILALALIGFFVARRKRQQRAIREKQLREMALGTDRSFPYFGGSTRSASRNIFSGYRSASWGSRQEASIEATGSYPACEPRISQDLTHNDDHAYERSNGGMLDVPNPNRGQKNKLRARGPAGFGSHNYVFTIEEEEERSQQGSIKRPHTAVSRPLSDPFKDPPANPQTDEAAQQRRQEVETWVEDWASAAESMNLERSTSKANSRTYSNLSAYHSASSGDKSDRTNSDLSERTLASNPSIQKSNVGTVSRNVSQRSASGGYGGYGGYALFSSAAAAMSRLAGRPDNSNLDRSASKRSISTGDLAQIKARRRGNSIEQGYPPPLPDMASITPREDIGGQEYFTPSSSPIKDYKGHQRRRSNSLTSQSMKALGVIGQATKRVLTGTSGVSVSTRIENFEANGERSSPTKTEVPEMSEAQSRRAVSSGSTFWRHKQGAKDWDDGQPESTGTVRRRSGRPQHEDYNDDVPDDWDIETAIQQRVVQVMFTVPKEKLRVVNADNLSLLSRTDTNASKYSDKSDEGKDVKRMSRVTEAGEVEEDSTLVGSSLHPDSVEAWKGKGRMMERTNSGASGATVGKAL